MAWLSHSDDFVVDLADDVRDDVRRGEWAIPAGVDVAPGVDLAAADPAAVDGRRFCVAVTRAGGRCSAPPLRDLVLCSPHAGLMDAREGGKARAARTLARRQEAEERMVLAEMGARALIRAEVVKHGEDLRTLVAGLMADAARGDRKAAQLLLGYLTQGYGSPAVLAGEHTPPDGDDITSLSTAELRAMLAAPPRNQAVDGAGETPSPSHVLED